MKNFSLCTNLFYCYLALPCFELELELEIQASETFFSEMTTQNQEKAAVIESGEDVSPLNNEILRVQSTESDKGHRDGLLNQLLLLGDSSSRS